MSAPPLPEAFGNYALGDFVEVTSPASISWLPQTPGWLLVAAVIAWYVGRWAWRRLAQWYRNRYRKEALARLQTISSSASCLNELSTLLKITAVAAYDRPETAQLNGPPWPEFLNRKCASEPFDEELSALLAEGIYRQVSLSDNQRDRLLEAARVWITGHREKEHVA
jgi:hypothetical protein